MVPAKIYKHKHLARWFVWWVMYFAYYTRLSNLIKKHFWKLHEKSD